VGPVLLGIAAVTVGVGLYFILHHKSGNGSSGTTTP
jgi:hypothetical protein